MFPLFFSLNLLFNWNCTKYISKFEKKITSSAKRFLHNYLNLLLISIRYEHSIDIFNIHRVKFTFHSSLLKKSLESKLYQNKCVGQVITMEIMGGFTLERHVSQAGLGIEDQPWNNGGVRCVHSRPRDQCVRNCKIIASADTQSMR